MAPTKVPPTRRVLGRRSKPAYMGRLLQNLLKEGCDTFVEVGGQPLLGAMIDRRAAALNKTAVILPSMRRGGGACHVMSEPERLLRRRACLCGRSEQGRSGPESAGA